MTRQIKQRWYSGHEILNMGVKGFELLEAVKGNKLIPHDKDTGKKVVDYNTLPRRPMSLEQIEAVEARKISSAPTPINESPIKYSAGSRTEQIKSTAKWMYENKRPEIPIWPNDCVVDHFSLESVKGFIYSTDEVTAYLTELSPQPQPDITPPAEHIIDLAPLSPKKETFRQADRENDAPAPISENSFHNEGKTWTISFNGEKISVPDSKRIRYIAHLLCNPLRDFLCSDLYIMVSGTDPDSKADKYKISSEQLAAEGMSFSDMKSHIVCEENDKLIIQDIKNILIRKHHAEDSSADHEIIESIQEELDLYRAELVEEHGIIVKISESEIITLSRLPQKIKNLEAIRKLVSKEIKKGIERFKTEIPELYTYLDDHIKKGKYCLYTPGINENSWNVKL